MADVAEYRLTTLVDAVSWPRVEFYGPELESISMRRLRHRLGYMAIWLFRDLAFFFTSNGSDFVVYIKFSRAPLISASAVCGHHLIKQMS